MTTEDQYEYAATAPIDPTWTYHFHRSDVPLLLFFLSPIFGLILDAPLWWWVIVPCFWGTFALIMGYSIGRST